MVEAIKRGAEEFIMKPFDETEVLETLSRVAENGIEEEELDLDELFGDKK
jgi:FixJ family two-component response regulator